MKQCKQVLTAFQAKRPLKNEKYLGISIPMWNQSGDGTHQVRTEKCWNKFDGWKVGLLSHVGMSVIVKSTISTIPVYYMSALRLQKRTITACSANTVVRGKV
jgi:hypothetical protein